MIKKFLNWLFEKFVDMGMATEENVENYINDQLDDWSEEVYSNTADRESFDNLEYDFEKHCDNFVDAEYHIAELEEKINSYDEILDGLKKQLFLDAIIERAEALLKEARNLKEKTA